MDAALAGETTAQAQKQTTKEYKSPPHALIWFFRKSRDLWKSKCLEIQASIKRLKTAWPMSPRAASSGNSRPSRPTTN